MSRQPRMRIGNGVVTAAALAVLATAIAGFGVAVHSVPADTSDGPGNDPLVVATEPVLWEEGYEVTRHFVGRIEARQESDLGFELGGMVTSVAVEEGDLLEAGEVVATLDSARLEARRSELLAARDEAHARLELAELRLKRVSNSFERGAANVQELDDADKSYDASAATLERAISEVASVDVDISKTVIRSPFDAVVSERYVDAGRVIGAGAPVLTLLERTHPEARIGVSSSAVDSLSVGQDVSVSVGNREIEGSVSAILPTRDRLGRAVDVIVQLDAELNGLRQGDLARLAVVRSVEARGFWVPMQALTEGSRGLWSIYVLSEGEGTPKTSVLLQADVELLHVEADRAFVRGALPDGSSFVQRGLHRVTPGMPVHDESSLAESSTSPRGDQ